MIRRSISGWFSELGWNSLNQSITVSDSNLDSNLIRKCLPECILVSCECKSWPSHFLPFTRYLDIRAGGKIKLYNFPLYVIYDILALPISIWELFTGCQRPAGSLLRSFRSVPEVSKFFSYSYQIFRQNKRTTRERCVLIIF